MSDADPSHKPRLRPAQVFATTLAGVSGAFLASRLGVYGTVVGAGVLSAVSTIGAELYLRSLDRTKALAATASKNATPRAVTSTPTVELTEPPTTLTQDAHAPEDAVEKDSTTSKRRVPWRALAVGSAMTFVLAMVAVTGFEAMTGGTLSGSDGNTVVKVIRGESDGRGGGVETTDNSDQSEEPSDGVTPAETPRSDDGSDDEGTPEPTGEPTDDATDDVADEPDGDETPTESPSTPPSGEPTDDPADEPTDTPTEAPSGEPTSTP